MPFPDAVSRWSMTVGGLTIPARAPKKQTKRVKVKWSSIEQTKPY